MPSSLAVRIAASAPASLAYGLPGSTHTASKRARAPEAASAAASPVGIQYASRTSPSRAARASRSSGIRAWEVTCGERSPTRAIRAIGAVGAAGAVDAAGAAGAVVMRIILWPGPTSAPTIVPA